MRALYVQIVTVVVSLAVANALSCVPSVAADTPTTLLIAAFQQDQRLKTVDIRYTLSRVSQDHTTDVTDAIITHYVRTPEAVYLREEYPLLSNQPAGEYSYDRKAKEYRGLGYKENVATFGLVSTKPIGPLTRQDLHDPVEFPLFPRRWGDPHLLVELVEKGVVSPEKESVDGFECWRVDVSNPTPGIDKYRIWVGPTIGFCTRRVDIVRPSGTQTVLFRDYREVASDAWYPMTKESILPDSNGQYSIITKVKSIVVGKASPKEELIIKFPTGTHVRDQIRDMEYTVP